MIAVGMGGRFGFIDTSGRPVTGLRYDDVFSFRDGRALVVHGDDDFFIDRNGRRI